MKAFLLGTRRRKVLSGVGLLGLVGVGVAIAAIIYTGASGSGSAHVQANSTSSAITLTEVGSPELVAGQQTPTSFHVVNSDPAQGHHLDSLVGTVTTSPDPSCASFISWSSNGGNLLSNYSAGFDGNIDGGFYNTQASLPVSCGGASVTLSLTGQTTP